MNPLAQRAAQAVAPQGQEAALIEGAVGEDQVAPEEAVSPEDEVAAQQALDPSGMQPEEPTPEEQEMFTKAEVAIKGVIYNDKKSFGAIAKMLEKGKSDPVNTLADAGLMVFQTVDGLAKDGLPEIIIMRSAEVALDYVIKMAEETGIMQVDEATANQAMKALVTKAGEAYGLDVSEIEAAYGNQAIPENIRTQMSSVMGGQPGVATGDKGAV